MVLTAATDTEPTPARLDAGRRADPALRRVGVALLACAAVVVVRVPALLAVEANDPAAQASLASTAAGVEVTCAEAVTGVSRLTAEVRKRQGEEGDLDRQRRLVAELLVDRELVREAEASGTQRDPGFLERLSRGRDRILLAGIESDFAAAVSVSTDEIEARYELNSERFKSPPKMASSFILLRLSTSASDVETQTAFRQLESIRQEFVDGARFGALARRYSHAENATRGGAVASSARGTLLEAYEDVAWSLEPGEVSQPLRLPDGAALIRLEQIYPAREASLAQASPQIAKRLAYEETQNRRQEAIEQARRLWPATIDWGEGERGEVPDPVVTLAGESLELADLGLAGRPPRLVASIESALERLWLTRLAQQRGLEKRPELAQRLSRFRDSLLVSEALERRVATRLPTVPEADLRRLYERQANFLAGPERRTFEVVFVPGVEGELRSALARAQAAARDWRETSKPPGEERLEVWGPLPRSLLGSSTSPRLAALAFALLPGQVSEPSLLEEYRAEIGRFLVEGYVVLRLARIETPEVPSFESTHDELRRFAVRGQIPGLRRQIREQMRDRLGVVVDSEALSRCPLLKSPEDPARQPAAGD